MQLSAPLAGFSDPIDVDDEEEYMAWGLLWDAWQRYWDDATYLFERVYSVFAYGGSFDQLRQEFSRLGVHRTIGMRLKALHAAIRGVRDAFNAVAGRAPASETPTAPLTNAAFVMDALLALISCGGSAEASGEMSWLSLRMLLTDAPVGRSGPHHTPESVAPFEPRPCQRSASKQSTATCCSL